MRDKQLLQKRCKNLTQLSGDPAKIKLSAVLWNTSLFESHCKCYNFTPICYCCGFRKKGFCYSHIPSIQRIIVKFVPNFLTYHADRQTVKSKNITSSAEVATENTYCRRLVSGPHHILLPHRRRIVKQPRSVFAEAVDISCSCCWRDLYKLIGKDQRSCHWSGVKTTHNVQRHTDILQT